MYFCLPARNIYDKQDRVAAHRHTPAAKDELRKLGELNGRLRELAVSRIICSDLDGQSGELLARRLNVPVEEWESLRRWNWGKWHGASATRAFEARPVGGDPTVPVKGGDSAASFRKRMAAARDRLSTAPHDALVIADPEVLEKLTGAGGAQRYHIYEVELVEPAPDPAPLVAASVHG